MLKARFISKQSLAVWFLSSSFCLQAALPVAPGADPPLSEGPAHRGSGAASSEPPAGRGDRPHPDVLPAAQHVCGVGRQDAGLENTPRNHEREERFQVFLWSLSQSVVQNQRAGRRGFSAGRAGSAAAGWSCGADSGHFRVSSDCSFSPAFQSKIERFSQQK